MRCQMSAPLETVRSERVWRVCSTSAGCAWTGLSKPFEVMETLQQLALHEPYALYIFLSALSSNKRDIYSAGYAVGLAKQGKFRQAAREARRIRFPEYRVCALARIAAEMKKRGL
ncbi:MAG: hypothetical protein NZ874_04115 [Fimbriimonadales bacterium]|nr:hypothetical protein [Fimbriimonadales bacterium]